MRTLPIVFLLNSLIIFGCFRKNSDQHRLERDFQKAIEDTRKDPLMGLNADSVKEEYGSKFYDLRAIINRNDPIGLISMGAPEDEYEPEVKTIIVQLSRTSNTREITNLVYSEFERWFGDAGKREIYKNFASEIYIWAQKENIIMDNQLKEEHAVIVHFNYGIEELDSLFTLEDELEKVILEKRVGEYDGHEIAIDHSDGYLYMYGPNAETLFKAIKPILESSKFMKGATAVLRFGPPIDETKEIEVEIR